VETEGGKVKKILCYKFDQRVGNTDEILLQSLRTIRDPNIDSLHHMDQSLEGIASPPLFLKDKVAGRKKKKGVHGKARSAENFLREQKRKYNRGNSCAVLLASSTPVAKKRFYYEDGSLRKCLLDDQGNRLKDAEGNLKR
jgi:hypothetical protein